MYLLMYQSIFLNTLVIPNKYERPTLRFQCLVFLWRNVSPCWTPKDFEMSHKWFPTNSIITRSDTLQSFVRNPILDVCDTTNSCFPKGGIKRLCMYHIASHLLEISILPFCNSILFWSVGNLMLKINPLKCTKLLNSIVIDL